MYKIQNPISIVLSSSILMEMFSLVRKYSRNTPEILWKQNFHAVEEVQFYTLKFRRSFKDGTRFCFSIHKPLILFSVFSLHEIQTHLIHN